VGAGAGGEAAREDPVPAGAVHLPRRPDRRAGAGRVADRPGVPLITAAGRGDDRIAPFRPPLLAIRWGTTAVGLALASSGIADGDRWVLACCAVILGYTVYRTFRPLVYVDDTRSLLRVLVEVAITVLAVVSTGYWDSPLVFSLLTAIIVAGFARGFSFALRIAAASVLAVAVPEVVRNGWGGTDARTAAQWAVELLLVGVVAGYARRISGEADRVHSLALDRLGRLSDANALLFSLHQVAQNLPASLDLGEVLDGTLAQLRGLFDYDAVALLLLDETDGSWTTARREGVRLPERFRARDLPPPLAQAIATGGFVAEPNLMAVGGPGLAPTAASGMYGVLTARGSIIGLVSVEHREPYHHTPRDVELFNGFIEPAALAIDNARWFTRLRTVGADEERTRIARDLHDRIGQSLAYLAFEIDRIVRNDQKGEAVGESLDQLRKDVRGVIREVRDTLYDLRTDVSDTQDMASTLRGFLDRVRERSGMEVALDADESARLPLPQERELWRIAQEAITNVERHARANRVHARWRSDGRAAELEITDDGTGFPENGAGRLDSYGLVGMRERASAIGATLDVDSTPGRGTRVRCVLRPA
jgi:signal transduction histidine kinase